MAGDIVAALAIAGLIFLIVRGRRRAARAALLAQQAAQVAPGADSPAQNFGGGGDPLELQPGNAIQWPQTGERVVIQGTVTFAQGQSAWREHYVKVDGERCFVSVEDTAGMTIIMWIPQPELRLEPGPQTIQLYGLTYTLTEEASATYVTTGETDLRSSGNVRYFEYSAAQNRRLLFRQFDNRPLEVSLGKVVPGLTIYPA